MKKITLILTLVCFTCGISIAQGNLLRGAASVAGRGITTAVTKKAESIAEKKTEAFLNKKFAEYESRLNAELAESQKALALTQDSLMKKMNVPFEDEYAFSTIATSQTIVTNKDGKADTVEMKIYINPTNKDYYGYGLGDMITVIDLKNKVSVVFSNANGEKFYVSYQLNEDTNSKNSGQCADVTTTKLGTKTICGYSCQGYKIPCPAFSGETWVTSSSDFSTSYKNATNSYSNASGFPMLAKGTITNSAGEKTQYFSEVKDVKKNSSTVIKKADYKSAFATE